MLVIKSDGVQVTNNIEMSASDQLPQYPSFATLNYIFDGKYYGDVYKRQSWHCA